ncbi:DUF3427 domain-containing protein [Eubacteriales bacterium KG127]
MITYKRVFGDKIKMGILSGREKNWDNDFIFSTMQTMSKEESLRNFETNHFDIIVIDEVHRAGAKSYEKIMNYFTPNIMWLGMTASPDRSDGYDIYKLFDNNIAHEIRLQEALAEELLCPFHYFGIADIEACEEENSNIAENGSYSIAAEEKQTYYVNKKDKDLDVFRYVEPEKKAEYIIENAEYFGHSGDRVKGLVFCSRKEEAKVLSEIFNRKGFKTVALTGEDSIERRLECVEQLATDNLYSRLDYIFIVDVFNEGVDIPEVNQVIMLRPTESAIIFIQQLGRGLRKSHKKEYVVIIDFIGNYKTNFLIPIALFGDRSFNKDNVRKYMMRGNNLIPGCSTISFDEISRKSIDTANFTEIKRIKESYFQLKNKLGRIPDMMDFDIYGSMDLQCIFDNKSLGSYHTFLSKYDKKDYHHNFSKPMELMINFISEKFANGKRIHELLILKYILEGRKNIFENLKNDLKRMGINYTENTKVNLTNILSCNFETGDTGKKYQDCKIIQYGESEYSVAPDFKKMLQNEAFKRNIEEIVEYSLYKNKKEYGETYEGTPLNLYSKYTYSDVCRLLEWEKNEVSLNIGGYKYNKKTKTYPVFINYNKSEDIADTIKYEDRFVNNSTIIAISKSGRIVDSDDVQNAINAEERKISMHLFVRKNKDDKQSKEFYYLGKIRVIKHSDTFTLPNTNKTAVELLYKLDIPVRNDIYEYITK